MFDIFVYLVFGFVVIVLALQVPALEAAFGKVAPKIFLGNVPAIGGVLALVLSPYGTSILLSALRIRISFPRSAGPFVAADNWVGPILWLCFLFYGVSRFGRRAWWALLASPIAFSFYLGLIALFVVCSRWGVQHGWCDL